MRLLSARTSRLASSSAVCSPQTLSKLQPSRGGLSRSSTLELLFYDVALIWFLFPETSIPLGLRGDIYPACVMFEALVGPVKTKVPVIVWGIQYCTIYLSYPEEGISCSMRLVWRNGSSSRNQRSCFVIEHSSRTYRTELYLVTVS